MDDLTTQELERMAKATTEAGGKFNNAVSDMIQDMYDREKAEAQLAKDLKRQRDVKMRGIAQGADDLTRSFESASTYLMNAVAGGLLGAAVAAAVKRGQALTQTYTDLAERGNTFGGSILEMSIAAASAGMPLEKFAEVTAKSSLAVKQLGDKEWPKLQKSFRELAVQNGMYGMSVAQLDTFQGHHLETLRRANALTGKSSDTMSDLALITTGLADVSGVARDQIAQMASSALQGSNALALVKGMPAHMREQATEQMMTVTSILAAQAEAAGEFLTQAFTNTKAMDGFSEFTDQGQALIGVGLGNVAAQLNTLSDDMSVEQTVETVNLLHQGLSDNLQNIKTLAMAGDANAQQMLKVYQDLEKMSAAEIRRKAEEAKTQDGLTKFFLTIETIWDSILAGFKEGLLKGFRPLMDGIGDITKSQWVAKFKDLMIALGEKAGTGIAGLIMFLQNSPEIFDKIGNTFKSIYDGVTGVDWGGIFDTMKDYAAIIGAMMAVTSPLVGAVSDLLTAFPKLTGAALAGVGAFLLMKKLKSMFGNNMVVNAATVIVNDGGMGGGLGDLGGDGKGRRRKRGSLRGRRKGSLRRLGRMGKGGKLGKLAAGVGGLGMVGGGIAKSIGSKVGGKGLTMGALKMGVKKIPVIGALAGLGFAASRAAKGDWLGAAGELASGAASIIPGVGTAASLAIDGALMARDSGAFAGKGGPKGGPKSGLGKKGLALGAAGLGVAGAGLAAYSMMGDDDEEATDSEKKKKAQENDEVLKTLKKMEKHLDALSDQQDSQTAITLQGAQDQLRELRNQTNQLERLISRMA